MAQALVKGRVLENDQPLAHATIQLNRQKAVSDTAGYFVFEQLAQGKYSLYVTTVGFDPYHLNFSLKDGEVKELVIALQPALSSMEEVVITGTMKPVQKSNSPIAVEVYTPQFFKKNPTASIFESLQGVNGVRPQINCSVCNTGDIHINGLEGPYTMVTIDGMPIVSSLASVYGLFGIPNGLIEKVEIIKGPASGLYGSEAIGGLINIITRQPEKAPRFTANLMTTSWQEHMVDMGVRWKAGKFRSLLGINYFNYGKPFDRNKDGFTDVTLQHRASIFNKWTMQRPGNRTASFAVRGFYEDRWGGQMAWNKSHRGSDNVYGESIYTKRLELIGAYQLPVPEKLTLSLSATHHNQDSWYGVIPYKGIQDIVFGQLTWSKPASPAHDLLAGLAGRYNYYDDNSTATIDTSSGENSPQEYFLPGIFIQDEWQLRPSHLLLSGLRFDYHPQHGPIFTPRLAYKWKMNERATFRVNAGTGFRVVNLFTEDHAALTGSRAVEIKEALHPEKSYNVNLNQSFHVGKGARSITLDASAWYTWFLNQILPDYETDPNKIIYQNLDGHAVSRGFSLNADFNWKQKFKGNLGGTFQEVMKVSNSDRGEKIKQQPVLTERWSGTWAFTWTFAMAGMAVDYTGNIYGPMRLPLISDLDPRQAHSPVWSIQNLQLTKWFAHNWEIYGGIKNLLNWTPAKNNPFLIARAHDPFDREIDYDRDGKTDTDASGKVLVTTQNPFGLSFDPAYVYAPNQGRRVFLGIRYSLK